MNFEDYYKEFFEVFGHPICMMTMMMIGIFFMIEVMHLNYHADGERDAHGFCGQQEWVKELIEYKEENMY